MLIRSGEVALQRQIDQPAIMRREMFVPALQPLHRSWTVILQDNIGLFDQTVHRRLTRRFFQIDREAAFVAVERREESRAKAAQAAGVIAVGSGLYLNDISAEFGEQQTGGRPHDGVREFKNL